MLTPTQIRKYRELDNPPQSLYMALKKQVNIRKSPGRSFSLPEGGYGAMVCYYYMMKILEYDDEVIKDEAAFTDTTIKNIQKHLSNIIRGGGEEDRTNNRFHLIANYMIHEQLGYPYEDKSNV